MQLLDYGQDQGNNVRRPLLNSKASIVLETAKTLRVDKVQQSLNDIDGIALQDFYEENTFTNVVFESDRVSLKQLDDFISIYRAMSGTDMYKDKLNVTSIPVTEGKITGFDTMARGQRFESAIVMELPANSSYNKAKVENALTFTGQASDFGTPSDIKLTNPTAMNLGSSMVITPKFNKKFKLSDEQISTPYMIQAANELGIQKSSMTFAGQVNTTGAREILDD